MSDWIVLLASALAGCIDAIVGGGGLILAPALFAAYPAAAPATLFGTNKSAAFWGTAFASWRYSRRVELRWGAFAPAIALTFAGALIGAWAVTGIDPQFLRRALPFVLLALLLYTLVQRDLGREHEPRLSGRSEAIALAAIGFAIGGYDGFFGPGTGSFFVFALVRWLGYDFLHASAGAKLLNLSSNVAAIALFAAKGHVWWQLGLQLACANLAGSLLGTRLALRHGAVFVRAVFLVVVAALICKTGADAWLG